MWLIIEDTKDCLLLSNLFVLEKAWCKVCGEGGFYFILCLDASRKYISTCKESFVPKVFVFFAGTERKETVEGIVEKRKIGEKRPDWGNEWCLSPLDERSLNLAFRKPSYQSHDVDHASALHTRCLGWILPYSSSSHCSGTLEENQSTIFGFPSQISLKHNKTTHIQARTGHSKSPIGLATDH